MRNPLLIFIHFIGWSWSDYQFADIYLQYSARRLELWTAPTTCTLQAIYSWHKQSWQTDLKQNSLICLTIDRSKLTRTNKWLVTNFTLILEQIPLMLNWPTSFHRPDLWHYQLLADKHFSLDSQGDFHTGCQNVIQQPQ